MTMFIPSPQLTTLAPLVSSDKGSVGNRINCAGAQFQKIQCLYQAGAADERRIAGAGNSLFLCAGME